MSCPGLVLGKATWGEPKPLLRPVRRRGRQDRLGIHLRLRSLLLCPPAQPERREPAILQSVAVENEVTPELTEAGIALSDTSRKVQ